MLDHKSMSLNIKSSFMVHHTNLLDKVFKHPKLSVKDPQMLYYPIQVNYQILHLEIAQLFSVAKQTHLLDCQELHGKIKANVL